MPTGRTNELQRRFGPEITFAISDAYLKALWNGRGLADAARRAIVDALITEAEAGRVAPDHLRTVAERLASPARSP